MNKRKRLTKKQREALLIWIGEGLETDEINVRAAKWKPPFKVTRQQVDHYRKTRKISMKEIQVTGELQSLTSGLAVRETRVSRLQKLADLLIKDLFDSDLLWTDEVKGIGAAENFQRIDYKEFNKAEVDSLRGVLDDIAAEVGDRSRRQVLGLNIDLTKLSDAQLERIAKGEDPMKVLMNA